MKISDESVGADEVDVPMNAPPATEVVPTAIGFVEHLEPVAIQGGYAA